MNSVKDTAKMNPKLKAKWIEALRSGKYKQTTKVLKDKKGYCCLGVLRELIDPGSDDADENAQALSEDMCEIAGLERYTYKPANVQNIVSKMNDDGQNFLQIADYIEANL